MYLVLSCDYRLAEIYAKAGVSPSPSLFSENSTHRSKSEHVININDPNDIAIKVSQQSQGHHAIDLSGRQLQRKSCRINNPLIWI